MNKPRLDPVFVGLAFVSLGLLVYLVTMIFPGDGEVSSNGLPIPVTEPREANRQFHEN